MFTITIILKYFDEKWKVKGLTFHITRTCHVMSFFLNQKILQINSIQVLVPFTCQRNWSPPLIIMERKCWQNADVVYCSSVFRIKKHKPHDVAFSQKSQKQTDVSDVKKLSAALRQPSTSTNTAALQCISHEPFQLCAQCFHIHLEVRQLKLKFIKSSTPSSEQ